MPRSQSSMEYLMIVAVTFAIVVPTAYLFYNYSKQSSSQIADTQIVKLGRTIIDTSKSVHYSGRGSKSVLSVEVPQNVILVTTSGGRELIFNVSNDYGMSEIVFFSSVNLTTNGINCNSYDVCYISGLNVSGPAKIKIEAISDESVSIETV